MKYCSKCGAPMPDNSGFCGVCGGEMTSNNTEVGVNIGKQNTGLGMKFKIGIGAVLVVLLLTGGFLGWNYFSSAGSIDKKLEMAVKYLNDNNYEKAILAYNEAISIDPKAVKAYQGLAKVYTLQGKYDDAKDTYDKGLAAVANEDQIMLRLGLGGMYIDQGQMDNAEKTFQEIKDNNAGCLEAYWGLAMVYKQKGDTANAEAMLKQATENNPSEYRAYNALALYQQQNSQSDETFNNLVKSLSLEINQQEAYLVLSDLFKDNWTELRTRASGLANQQAGAMLEFYSYYAAGDYQNALNTYEAKLKDQDSNDKAHILAAIAMYKTGDTSGADELIKQISNKDINKWLLSDIAEYYYAAGDREKARATAIKALKANSTNLDAVALLQRINTNDEEGKIYSAEYLLYNWKPVKEVRESLEELGIKIFIKSVSDGYERNKISTVKETDPKLTLLQAAKEYCRNKPYWKNIDLKFESPYGNPQTGDYIIGITDISKDTGEVIVGPLGSEGLGLLFRHTTAGNWVYVRDIPDSSEPSGIPGDSKPPDIAPKGQPAYNNPGCVLVSVDGNGRGNLSANNIVVHVGESFNIKCSGNCSCIKIMWDDPQENLFKFTDLGEYTGPTTAQGYTFTAIKIGTAQYKILPDANGEQAIILKTQVTK